MILTQIIINFLLTILMLLCGETIKACWKALNEEQKDSTTESTQRIFKLWKKKLKLKNKLRSESWNDWEGTPTKGKIELTLEKIKRAPREIREGV